MRDEDPITAYARVLHQDIGVGVTDLAGLVHEALTLLSLQEREVLRRHLPGALNGFTASELKGKLNRGSASIGFNNSKAAHAFLAETLEQLLNWPADH